jgi:hypothetical protein
MNAKVSVLFDTIDQINAKILAGKLNSRGISAKIQTDNHGCPRPWVESHKVIVNEKDLEEARKYLELISGW